MAESKVKTPPPGFDPFWLVFYVVMTLVSAYCVLDATTKYATNEIAGNTYAAAAIAYGLCLLFFMRCLHDEVNG